jgi:hypothetical protein
MEKRYHTPETASQQDKILAHLFHEKSISPKEALELYDCMRLAARISDLQRDYNINFVRVVEKHTLRNGHTGTHTRYQLPEVVPYDFQRRAWDLAGVDF